jgi:RNA polymerase sigma-70 factor, ECF subfamily
MSSSFPAARFPALPLGKEGEVAQPHDRDAGSSRDEPSDEALLERICNQDQDALGLLFRRYARLVWSIAKRILQDGSEAEDVTQEVFLRIYKRASVFDRSKGPPRRLIVFFAYQAAFTRRRYLRSRHFPGGDDTEADATSLQASTPSLYDESIEAHFGRDGLRLALAAMSHEQRETLRLHFFEGYTINEIAGKLAQSPGNVKHHLYRGLDKLRRQIPKRLGDRF